MASPAPTTYSAATGKAVHAGHEGYPHATLDLIAGTPEGQWVKANLNAFSAVWPPDGLRPVFGGGKHVPSKILLAWSGFAWDYNRSRLYIWGGGHANTSGNDVYVWDANTRLWSLGVHSSDVMHVSDANESAYDTVDGYLHSPISSHTYASNCYLPVIDRIVNFGGAAHSSGGGFVKRIPPGQSPHLGGGIGPYRGQVALFGQGFVGGLTGSNPATGTYAGTVLAGAKLWEPSAYTDRGAANIEAGALNSSINGGSVVTKENGRDVIYFMCRNSTQKQLARIEVVGQDFVNDVVTKVGSNGDITSSMGPVAFDTARRIFLNPSERSVDTTSRILSFWDLKPERITGQAQSVRPAGLTGPGVDFLVNTVYSIGDGGCAYDPVRNKFVYWAHGQYSSDAAFGTAIVGITPPDTVPTPTTGWHVEVLREHNGPGDQPMTDTEANAQGVQVMGILGKFKYAPDLDAFVGLQHSTQGNIWIWKPFGWVDPRTQS